MNSLTNALQRGIETQLFKYASQYPLLAWMLFYILGLFIFYISLGSLSFKKKFTKYNIHFIIFIVIYFFVLIHFTITKSYGLLIYPCLFAWLATFYIIFLVFKKHNTPNNTPTIIKKDKKYTTKTKSSTNKNKNKNPKQPTKKDIDISKLSKARKRYNKKNNH